MTTPAATAAPPSQEGGLKHPRNRKHSSLVVGTSPLPGKGVSSSEAGAASAAGHPASTRSVREGAALAAGVVTNYLFTRHQLVSCACPVYYTVILPAYSREISYSSGWPLINLSKSSKSANDAISYRPPTCPAIWGISTQLSIPRSRLSRASGS